MPDNARVNELIREKGFTKSHVAGQLGISRQALSLKLHGKMKWSIEDIKNIKVLFSLSPEEAFDIFLPEK